MRRIILILTLSLAAHRLASADIRFSAGPTIGTTVGGVTEQGEAVYGGQVAVEWADAWALELVVLRFTDHPEEERLGITATSALGTTPVHLSLRYSRPLAGDRLHAYVLGGPGYYFCDDGDVDVEGLTPGGPVRRSGEPRVSRRDAYGYQVAGGFECRIRGCASVLVEYRYAAMKNDASLSGLSAATPEGQHVIDAFEKDFWDNNELGILRLAAIWRF